MNAALKKAQSELKIKSVLLRNVSADLNEDIDAETLNFSELVLQSYRGVSKVQEIEALPTDSDQDNWVEYHFFYSVGLRAIPESEETTDDEVSPSIEIEATFDATYLAIKKQKIEAIEAFSEHNVGYHVWPYWRELVQSTCARLNIQHIPLPLYFVPKQTD